MADLVVTEAVVVEAAEQLKIILAELNDQKALWKDGDLWGHPTVENVMNDFEHSWWVKREKLKENLGDLQQKMVQAGESWTSVDNELAKALDGDESPKE